MPQHSLGRRHAPDPRDARFLLAPRLDAAIDVVASYKLWPLFAAPLDQGASYCPDPNGRCGTCVGWGWKHFLMAAPLVQTKYEHPPSPLEIYQFATRLDEWPDNDDDPTAGTSVRAGAKALAQMGLVARYEWATSADEARRWVCGVDADGHYVGGPLVAGVNWYDSFETPDARGLVKIAAGARVIGGHCFAILGYTERLGLFACVNSWGTDWGRHGRFFVEGEVLERLLSEGGELCVAIETRPK